jgi:hypothetical protein
MPHLPHAPPCLHGNLSSPRLDPRPQAGLSAATPLSSSARSAFHPPSAANTSRWHPRQREREGRQRRRGWRGSGHRGGLVMTTSRQNPKMHVAGAGGLPFPLSVPSRPHPPPDDVASAQELGAARLTTSTPTTTASDASRGAPEARARVTSPRLSCRPPHRRRRSLGCCHGLSHRRRAEQTGPHDRGGGTA